MKSGKSGCPRITLWFEIVHTPKVESLPRHGNRPGGLVVTCMEVEPPVCRNPDLVRPWDSFGGTDPAFRLHKRTRASGKPPRTSTSIGRISTSPSAMAGHNTGINNPLLWHLLLLLTTCTDTLRQCYPRPAAQTILFTPLPTLHHCSKPHPLQFHRKDLGIVTNKRRHKTLLFLGPRHFHIINTHPLISRPLIFSRLGAS